MTPDAPGGLCDRLMIWIVCLIVVVALGIAGTLEFTGHTGASAAFIGVAVAALGILSPSPLKQHSQGASDTSVDASTAANVTVNSQPADIVAGEQQP